jgi:hypothetical protein
MPEKENGSRLQVEGDANEINNQLRILARQRITDLSVYGRSDSDLESLHLETEGGGLELVTSILDANSSPIKAVELLNRGKKYILAIADDVRPIGFSMIDAGTARQATEQGRTVENEAGEPGFFFADHEPSTQVLRGTDGHQAFFELLGADSIDYIDVSWGTEDTLYITLGSGRAMRIRLQRHSLRALKAQVGAVRRETVVFHPFQGEKPAVGATSTVESLVAQAILSLPTSDS